MTKIKGIMQVIIVLCIIMALVGFKALDVNKSSEVNAKTSENNYSSVNRRLETVRELPRGHFLALQIKELDKMISDKMNEIKLSKESQVN